MSEEQPPGNKARRVWVFVVAWLTLFVALLLAVLVLRSPIVLGWLARIEDGLSNAPLPVVEILVVTFLSVLPHALNSIAAYRYPDRALVRYPGLTGLAIEFSARVATVLVLYYIALNQSAGLASLGLQLSGVDLAGVVVLGLAAFLVFILLHFLASRLLLRKQPGKDTPNPYAEVVRQYQTTRERLAFLLVLAAGVLAEELVYRGYLILLLGQRTGAPVAFAVLSILLSVVVHLYQGRSWILFHLLLSTILAGTVLLTGNLWTAIYIHLLLNVRSTLSVWFGEKKAKQEMMPNAS